MTIKELNKYKVPIIKIDHSLDRFEKMNLFQDKLDQANEILERVGLPGDKPGNVKGYGNTRRRKYAKAESKKDLSVVNEPAVEYKKKTRKKMAKVKRKI